MRIFCYMSSLPQTHLADPELLLLWKKSWTDCGFEAVILGPEDAKLDPRYEELRTHPALYEPRTNPREYTEACYVRWCAVASRTEPGEIALASDWDVIAYSYAPPSDVPLLPRFLSGGPTPCLVLGTKEHFSGLVDLLLEYARDKKRPTSKYLKSDVSDQHIFAVYPDRYGIGHLVSEFGGDKWQTAPVVHYPYERTKTRQRGALIPTLR